MSGLRLGSLFSGAAGLDMAVEAVLGTTTAWHAEIDPAASKVLAHRFPDVPNLGDLTAVDWSAVEPVDVICGGSPCQDVSHAGKRAGMRAGTRSGLWASMCDAIDVLRPQLVVWENVRGVLSAEADSALEPCPGCVGDDSDGPVLRALGRVLGDLADLGYDASWHGLRAADVGAPHGRFRVFVVAVDSAGVHAGRSDSRRGGETGRLAIPGSLHAGNAVADAERGRRAGRAPEQGRGSLGGTAATGPGCSVVADARGGSLARPASAGNGLRLAAERGAGSPADPDGNALRVEPVGELGRSGSSVAGHSGPNAPADTKGAGDGREPGLVCRSTGADGRSGSDEGRFGDAALGDGATAPDTEGDEQRESAELGPLRDESRASTGDYPATAWGQYGDAIRRWEQRLGRVAPPPTEAGTRGGQRLSPRFVEWMMGWPDGWVTDVPGISRNDALRICGNGVVPQQAAEALRRLLNLAERAA